jgi:hypothetical protein
MAHKKIINEVGKKRMVRVLVTPAQDEFLNSIMLKGATSESEVVRTALNYFMRHQFGIRVPA